MGSPLEVLVRRCNLASCAPEDGRRPEYPHSSKAADSPARQTVAGFLDQRGSSPRLNKNMVVFLAPDRARLAELDQAVRQYLAWKSIDEEREPLNLDAFQSNQARTKREQADETVRRRIPEAYQWLLVPTQPVDGPVEWEDIRLQGDEALAPRASKKLKHEDLLVTEWAGTVLRLELDRVPLWRGDHVSVKQLWEDFAKYLYLPRLKDSGVLLAAISDGASQMLWETKTFAYAEAWDERQRRYLGLRGGTGGRVTLDERSLVVKPEAARRQLDADLAQIERARADYTATGNPTPGARVADGGTVTAPYQPDTSTEPPAPPRLTRFHGAVALDATRLGRDAGTIAEAVVQHLNSLVGAEVEVTLEIRAHLPDGASDQVVRIVTENCRTLRFTSSGFEPS
jgi:hypothetical protein